jgi:MoaA/NifB/PqqE/SkfB family radical SAM enzyme
MGGERSVCPPNPQEAATFLYPQEITYNQLTDKFDGPEGVHEKILDYPISIVFNTSHECNLHCPYCFRRGSKLPPQTTSEIMSDLSKLPVDEPMRIVLSGGEPFWRSDIYEVMDFCAKQHWNVLVVSNGTYPVDFERLPKNFLLEFSLDAPNPEIYAQTRGGSAENYRVLVSNIREAVARGFRVRPNYLMSRVNTTPEILREIVEFSSNLGVSEIRLQRFKPWGGGKHLSDMYEFSQEEYIKICSEVAEYAREKGLKIRFPQNNRFLALGSVYVLPDGRVNLQAEDGPDQITLGSLREKTLKEIWEPVKGTFSGLHLAWLIRPKRII